MQSLPRSGTHGDRDSLFPSQRLPPSRSPHTPGCPSSCGRSGDSARPRPRAVSGQRGQGSSSRLEFSSPRAKRPSGRLGLSPFPFQPPGREAKSPQVGRARRGARGRDAGGPRGGESNRAARASGLDSLCPLPCAPGTRLSPTVSRVSSSRGQERFRADLKFAR